MFTDEDIKKEAFRIYQDRNRKGIDGTASDDYKQAMYNLWKWEYYRKLGKCPHCGYEFKENRFV